jgi:hypothetical protein
MSHIRNSRPAAGRLSFVAALALALPAVSAEPPAATQSAPPPAEAAKAAEPARTPAHTLPALFEELVKMSEAGVSSDLILKFLEAGPSVPPPGAADVIAMKERKLPDPVIAAVILRGAETRRHAASGRGAIAAPAIVRSLATDGELDPESYEFFWYHHAYPRALAGSYETLAPYNPAYFPGYGWRGGYGSRGLVYRANPIPWRTSGFSRDSFAPGRAQKPREAGPITRR